MPGYVVNLSPVGDEINLTLRGPGLQETGRVYVFANTARCAAFAEAVNFAYRQGLRAGRRGAADSDGRLMMVSGRNPDDLYMRPETWWERTRRFILG